MKNYLSCFGMSFIENIKKNKSKGESIGLYKNFLKRPLDVVFASEALVIFSPVIIITALLVGKKLGCPIIYTQERPGLNEKIFKLYKFRTMSNEKDSDGNLLPDEQRLNDFGKKLRSTSLDELPELINILKGDMSFVGPRPLLVRYLPYYKKEERIRHTVRPGLTGLAQVSGRNNVGWDERLKLDAKYVKSISFYSDVCIIVKTIMNVISQKDIVDAGNFCMLDLDDERRKNANQ